MTTKLHALLIASLVTATTLATNAAVLFHIDPVPPNALPSGNRPLNGFTVGTEFTVGSTDLLVTSLGYEDAGANGLTDAHQVGIWDSGGTLIDSATVPAGTGAPLIETWRFQPLSSAITLTAGQTYRIGAVTSAADPFTDANDAGGAGVAEFTVSGDATVPANPNRFAGGVLINPTNDGTATPLRWAPANLEYTVIPEPGVSLLGLASALVFLRRRR